MVDSLMDIVKLIDRVVLNRICELVYGVKFIGCVGVGVFSIVGCYLVYWLVRIGKKVIMYEDIYLVVMSVG